MIVWLRMRSNYVTLVENDLRSCDWHNIKLRCCLVKNKIKLCDFLVENEIRPRDSLVENKLRQV
jgi:hypothetical protein